jgi:antirestriction protein ArdC
MAKYLDFCARFHHYSWCNQWLILMSNPEATYVAGFKKWLTLNRYVRKGEHGIPILAPIMTKVTNDNGGEQDRLVGFKVVYVFDVSQTDGESIPEVPEWKSPQQNVELKKRLMKFAHDKGIKVMEKCIGHDIQGVSLGGKIVLDPHAGTKTLIHELAHELLHHLKDVVTDSKIRELEAEATAYVVGKHIGLEDLASPNYIALHGANAEMIMSSLERIRNTAAEIIQATDCESVAV